MKNYLFILAMLLTLSASAQVLPCYSDEAAKMAEKLHPEIAVYKAKLDQQIQEALKHIDYSKAKKSSFGKLTSTGPYYGDTTYYDIPIVVHVVHDYGSEYENTTDDDIFNAFAGWDSVYICHNSDTSSVIAPFKKWIGNPQIRLHLATIDPYGNPTKGITRHRSYLTHGTASNLYTAADQAKLDDWPPTSYVNIWVVNSMGVGALEAAAYAYWPSDAAAIPYYDGVIVLNSGPDYLYLANQPYTAGEVGKTVNHEMGHVFNLYHPWGSTNSPQVACGDDEVDDTPPTKGHDPNGCEYDMSANGLYDTACCQHYFKVYPSSVPGVDSLVDYPDTVNAQNIMDYTYCARMFTKGQVERMHIALNSDVAGRDSLWSPFNLQITGALAPRPDLPPIPAYSAWAASVSINSTGTLKYFGVVGGAPIYFRNESWNDTITSVNWTFSNNASISSKIVSLPGSLSTSFANSFSSPGWVTIALTATGNVGGTTPGAATTLVDSTSVYIADSTGIDPTGYFQEFNNNTTSQWPMFNYYNNNFKWQLANTGFYDNSSVEYVGYDSRSFPETVTGAPTGDFDDLFSPAFNLGGFGSGACNLDFMYSGQTRSSLAYNMNDSLVIYYSTNLGNTWSFLKNMTGTSLDNQGASNIAYAPSWQGQWSPETIAIPLAARSTHTIFRFRYYPNQDKNNTFSTGNNFYMDHISISALSEEVNILPANANGITVVPNPTHGDVYVLINNTGNDVVKVHVTDIAGRVVYTTAQQVNGKGSIIIPKSSISVSGMYLVQVVDGDQSRTEKLVVY